MEQPASQSAFNFIPHPIEQQLVAYQTGDLLDVYQLGWKRSAKKDRMTTTPKILSFLLALVGLASLVGVIIGINAVIQTTHLIVSSLGLLVIPPTFLTIVGVLLLWQKPAVCLIAFRDCFVYAKKTRVIVMPWNEIASYSIIPFKTLLRADYNKHIIRTKSGQTFQWQAPDRVIPYLSRMIKERVLEDQRIEMPH